MRRLVIGLAICVFSTHAFALGMGKLRVKSALDEPLRAEIELTSVNAGDLQGLEVTLGSQEDFTRAGVPRPAYLQALKFSVDGATSAINISTQQPAREPFLHFVVAVQWAGGKMVREYTALLDPPLYAKEQPAPVSTPKVVDTRAPAPSPEPPAAAMSPAMPETGTVASAGDIRVGEYGPTVEGDTLWSIASKLDTTGTDINIFQIMLALQRENPEAFINNNINLLKKGQMLRIGNIEAIAQIPKQEATVAYQAQLTEWQAYRGTVASSDEAVAMAEPKPEQEPAAASKTMPSPGAGQAKEKEVLRIVQATLDKEKAAGTGSAAEISTLKDQITTLEDSLASKELENKELRERVALLEDQVQNAKRLMEIESAGLAAAQKQAAEAQRQADEAAQKLKQAETDAEKTVQPESAASEATVTPAAPPAPKPDAIKAPPPAPKPKAEKPAAAPKPQSKPAKPQRVSGASRKPEKSWWESTMDSVLGGGMMYVGAIIAAVLLLAIGAVLFIRRRKSIAEFEESILTGTALDGHTDTTESAEGGGSDTSFLSDFGLGGGMGSVQADEVDPLAEAEVYLAYGRDEQAEEVLREATTRNPDRYELKLKLLEIYQHRNDVKSFETLAEELYPASGSGDVTVWRKVVDMGRKVSPDNPLFSQEIPATATAQGEDSTTTTTTTTTTVVAGGGEELLSASGTPTEPDLHDFPPPDSTQDLDQQLDQVSGLQQSMAQQIDEDSGQVDTGKTAKASTEDFPMPKPPELDFDLDLDEPGDSAEKPVIAATAGDQDEDTAELDLVGKDDLDDLDFDLGEDIEAPVPGAPDTTAVHAVASTDTAEITGFDLVDSDAAPTGGTAAGDDGQDNQEQWDDAATKLDLAKAYIDMGDKAGARSIIDEVLKEGNPAQRQQAGELAAQLG